MAQTLYLFVEVLSDGPSIEHNSILQLDALGCTYDSNGASSLVFSHKVSLTPLPNREIDNNKLVWLAHPNQKALIESLIKIQQPAEVVMKELEIKIKELSKTYKILYITGEPEWLCYYSLQFLKYNLFDPIKRLTPYGFV